MNCDRRSFLTATLLGLPVLGAAADERTAADPLPSWNDGAAKRSIIAFVDRVTRDGSPDFVPPAERVAVFDNDGTLWPENPIPFQLAFVISELIRLAPSLPATKSNPAIQAVMTGDFSKLHDGGMALASELIALTHSGMTVEQFESNVQNWMSSAKHPRFGKLYSELAYQPMLEVLAYLRDHQFKPFIVSGGGADFMRVWTERVYGIPPERVIGSLGKVKFEMKDDIPTLTKEPGIEFVDDKSGKPVAIHRFIGRRPIACFGNSDGDHAMLEWTTIGRPKSFGLIVHHTDAKREYAYDANPKSSGKLVAALADAPRRGWTVVDMQADWKRIFPFDQ